MTALDKQASLFFGTKVDSRLREAMFVAKPGDKKYFDGSAGTEFLQIVEFAQEKWIGKVVAPGPAVTEVEDVGRNILSILRRIAPTVRISASTVKIFVVGIPPPVTTGTDGDDSGKSSDDEGAFITY